MTAINIEAFIKSLYQLSDEACDAADTVYAKGGDEVQESFLTGKMIAYKTAARALEDAIKALDNR